MFVPLCRWFNLPFFDFFHDHNTKCCKFKEAAAAVAAEDVNRLAEEHIIHLRMKWRQKARRLQSEQVVAMATHNLADSSYPPNQE